MTGNAAIDSNAYVALNQGDVAVASLLGSYQSLHLPVPVLGELLYGAGASGRALENRERVLRFATKCTVLDATARIASKYAELKVVLRNEGTPIPDNDLWIAATCIQAGLPLITRDEHFARIPDMVTLGW
jgi:tRNA(fMet)-specific endonuclease VapC